jgi:predicted DsbA family dithiol-disulfide isomerase
MEIMKAGRRIFLGSGAVAILGAVSYQFFSKVLEDPLEFEALDKPRGFRRMAGGFSSIGFDPFFGIGARPDPAAEHAFSYVKENVCETLFGPEPVDENVVQIASFSDYYCPYCRVLTQKLGRLEAESDGMVQITWHELPLLGESSEVAAKAAIAARYQGAYLKFHERFMKTSFRVNSAYLKVISTSVGLDHDQMLRDMTSAKVAQELRYSAALARVFSIIGTPAIVIGRTIVQGGIGERMLQRLIERERRDGPLKECGDA